MNKFIPHELFNRIEYEDPYDGEEMAVSAMLSEAAYKIPSATDTLVKKEAWHSACDLCARLGVLLERTESAEEGDRSVVISPEHGRLLRVVGCRMLNGLDEDADYVPMSKLSYDESSRTLSIVEAPEGRFSAVYSVQPLFTDNGSTDENGTTVWNPSLPRWFVERYGECITHGALMRIYAMSGKPWSDPTLARMHGVAYNNDLNRLSFGRITGGMRKHLLIDLEDFIVNSNGGN